MAHSRKEKHLQNKRRHQLRNKYKFSHFSHPNDTHVRTHRIQAQREDLSSSRTLDEKQFSRGLERC